MSTPREGPMVEKSLAVSQDPTIAPNALPPPPTPAPFTPSPRSTLPFLSPAQKPDELGRLEKFRVLRQLGKGGMGVVYLAEDSILHRQVALKVMLPELAANDEAADRFLREARAIAKVKHERIVTLYDVDKANGIPFLVMELLEGTTLQDFLRQGKRLTLAQVARIGREIASGLAAAHRHGVIHRDIKPGNIWLEYPSGSVKILDFGLARIQTPDQLSSISGGILGTPAYMSPEQALGIPLDARSDLFSLGTVLYQLCSDRLPFEGATMFELLEAIARLNPRPVTTWHPAIPPRLAELIHQLLQKKPERRPPSAAVVAERLDDILLDWPPTAQQISSAKLIATPPLPPEAISGLETGANASDNRLVTPPVLPSPPRTPPPPLNYQAPKEWEGPTEKEPHTPQTPGVHGLYPTPPPPPPGPAREGYPIAGVDEPPHLATSAGKSGGLKKPLLFGIMGALGCLLAAMVFELPFNWLMPASTSRAAVMDATPTLKIDVVYVLDVTLGMDRHVGTLRDQSRKIFESLKSEKIDAQLGLVVFRDRIDREEGLDDLKQVTFAGKPFTSSPDQFQRELSGITAWGGKGTQRSGLDALDLASQSAFREGATRVLVLVTASPPRVPDRDNEDEAQVAGKLRSRNIQQLHLLVSNKDDAARYLSLQTGLTGEEVGAGSTAWLDELDNGRVAETLSSTMIRDICRMVREQGRIRAVAAEGEFEKESAGRLLLAVGLWTMLITQGLALGLLLTSVLYLGQSLRRVFSAGKAALSLFTGIVAGLLAQFMVILLTLGASSGAWNRMSDLLAKLLGWTLIGAFGGLSVSFLLPGLSKIKGFIGGALGGFVGALLYVVFTALFGDMLGRWLGALALGFCVGLFVAWVESAFRRWWLEVRYPSGEVRTITLGPDIISVGSDPGQASVVLPEGPPIAFRFYLDGKQVFCEDHEGSFEIQGGDQQRVGDVAIILCSPDSVGQVGLVLELSSGKNIPLSEGLPLTEEDLPGLSTRYPDGTVALVSPMTAEPDVLLLTNRSRQQWKVTDPRGRMRIIDPGMGVTLASGTQIDFGRVQGHLAHKA